MLLLQAAWWLLRAYVNWQMKPKYHMMEEMFQYQAYECVNLDDYNEYLDEDFVGQVAKLAVRRGGWNTAKANASAVMDRYRA